MKGTKIKIEVKGNQLTLKDAILSRFAELKPAFDETTDLFVKKPTGKIITILTENLDDDLIDAINNMIENRYQ